MPIPIIVAGVGLAAAMYGQQAFDNWYYNEPWTKEKYDLYLRLNAFGPTHDYMEYLQARVNNEQYMKRYGIDYGDIKDPSKLPLSGAASGYYGSAYRMVSRNIDRLYH